MSVEALLGALARSAEADVAHLMADARREGERLLGEARASVQQQRTAAAARHSALLERSHTEAIDRTRAEAGLLVLEARARFLSRVRQACASRLATMPHDDAAAVEASMPLLLAEALQVLPPGPVEIRAAPAYEPLLAGATAQGAHAASLRVVAIPWVSSGFVAVTTGGDVEVDQRLETRLERTWQELSISLVNLIDPPDEDAKP